MISFLIKRFTKGADIHTAQGRTVYGNLSGGVGIACNLLLFAVKMLAGVLSGSISIIADAFNNFSDMGSSVITMLGFKLSSKPADKEHPFGHGRIEYMSGFIVSLLIVLVGFELLKSAAGKIFDPQKIEVTVLTVAILVASILVKLWMYLFNKRLGVMLSSTALLATARDCLNDTVSTSAVLVTTLLYRFFGWNIDGIAGMLVAVFIIYGGFRSALETVHPLLGEAPSKEFVDELKSRVLSYEMFTGVHDLIVHNYGPGRRFASIHIEVPFDVDVLRCHEEIDRCEKEVGEALGILLVAHMDPVDNGESVMRYKLAVVQALKRVDDSLSMHDFRMVHGEMSSNLIFDVVVPFACKIPTAELERLIRFEVGKTEPDCVCVINFDTEYN